MSPLKKISSVLLSDSFSSFINVSSSSLVGLSIAYFSLNTLGAEVFGLWALLVMLFSFALIAEQAIGLPIIRMVKIDDKVKNFHILSSSLLPILLFSLLIFVFSLLFNQIFLDRIENIILSTKNDYLILPFLTFVLFISLIGTTLSSFLIGFKKLYLSNYIKSFSRFIQLLVLLILFKLNFSFWALVLSISSYYFLTFFFCLITTLRHFKVANSLINQSIFFEQWTIGLKLINARFFGLFGDPFIKFSLGALVGLQSVAFFEICLKITASISQIPTLVFSGKVPLFKEYIEMKSSYIEVKNLFKSLDLYTLIYTLFSFLVSFIFIELVLDFFFKEKFDISVITVFFMLLLTLLFSSFFTSRIYFLITQGDGNTSFYAYLTQSFILLISITAIYIFIDIKTIIILTAAYCLSHISSSILILIRYQSSLKTLKVS
tara:strand:+ start:14752 stop:16050 length:1299 start_codon:yes stop_codon:yes gene_type:complete